MRILFQGMVLNGFRQVSSSKIKNNNDSCKCNYYCWPIINDSINRLTEEQILSLLKTLGVICKNYIEFSEFSNEILFKILEKCPTSSINVIEKYQANLVLTNIFKEIESPIHDGIDLKNILRLIDNVKTESKIKFRIFESIQIAIEKAK